MRESVVSGRRPRGPAESGGRVVPLLLPLLRAHLVVVLLARYSAFAITGQVGDLYAADDEIGEDTPERAALILTRIERASRLLREASGVGSGRQALASLTPACTRPASLVSGQADCVPGQS